MLQQKSVARGKAEKAEKSKGGTKRKKAVKAKERSGDEDDESDVEVAAHFSYNFFIFATLYISF